jgi:hypothetical protein
MERYFVEHEYSSCIPSPHRMIFFEAPPLDGSAPYVSALAFKVLVSEPT